MITVEQYNAIKYYHPSELKKWLTENNLLFSDIKNFALNQRLKTGRSLFCSCCGADQECGEIHTEECIWYEGQ